MLGHFSGPFGSGLRDAPIPPVGFPTQLREGFLFKVAFAQPVSELEDLVKAQKELRNLWPADAIAYTNTMIQKGEVSLYNDMALLQAWKIVSPAQVRGVLDAVRTRVLDFALALEHLAPDAGEATAEPPSRADVHNIVVNNIYGGATNLAVGSTQVEQHATNVPIGDREALFTALRAAGVADEPLAELDAALTADEADAATRSGKPGTRVQRWLGRLALESGSVAGKVATGAACGVVAALIKSYFGI